MIVYKRIFNEMAMPRKTDISKVYYHGTSSTQAGENIIKQGLKAPDIVGRKAKMTPIEGKVYMTPHLEYAIIYCIGADMLGSSLPEKWIEKDPYGYLFVINGKSLIDIQPDEDSIGEMIYKSEVQWLNTMASNNLTFNQYDKIMVGEISAWASSGKKLLKIMTDMQKLDLIDKGSHIAHGGSIKPSGVWKFDKTLTPQLKKDGSNFFKLAKRV